MPAQHVSKPLLGGWHLIAVGAVAVATCARGAPRGWGLGLMDRQIPGCCGEDYG